MASSCSRWTAVALILLASSPVIAQEILYVADDAPSNGDGLSWVTAYEHLQDALAAAHFLPEQISETRGTRDLPAGPRTNSGMP